MTLILTCMTPEWVVQVCDSRISYNSPGIAPFDSARKILFYHGHGARLSITYTGFATVIENDGSSRPLDIWIADVAPGLAAESVSVPHFGQLLMEAVDAAAVSTITHAPTIDGRLSIVMAGYVDDSAPSGAICISNFQKGGFRLPLRLGTFAVPISVNADVQFSVGAFHYSVLTKSEGIGLLIHGDHSGLEPPITTELQEALRSAAATAAPLQARDALVIALRRIAAVNPHGTVSADCWSRIVWKQGQHELFQSHFLDPSKQSLNPTMIGPGTRIDSVVVSQEPTDALIDARRKLDAGLLLQRFNAPTLIAFLEWSPTIRALAVEIHKLGIEITRPSYVGDVMRIVELSSYMYVSTLESHIASAESWAGEMVSEVLRAAHARMTASPVMTGESDERMVSVNREYLLVLLLVALDPDRYPSTPPPGVFIWPVSEELKAAARRHNPKFAK